MRYPNISAYKQAVVEQESFDKLQNVSIATQNGDLHYVSGNFATVFKAAQNGNYYALKCFLTDQVDRAERYQAITNYLATHSSPYFLEYHFYEQELWVIDAEYPVLWMKWAEGVTFGEAVKQACLANDVASLEQLQAKFRELALWLLDQELAHGDLKHDNIMLTTSGKLVLIDYDGMFVPNLAGKLAQEGGGKSYQHPKRSAEDYDRHLDDFSILVIWLSLEILKQAPQLYNQLNSGNNLVITSEDLQDYNSSLLKQTVEQLGLTELSTLLANSLSQKVGQIKELPSILKGKTYLIQEWLKIRQDFMSQGYSHIDDYVCSQLGVEAKAFTEEKANQDWWEGLDAQWQNIFCKAINCTSPPNKEDLQAIKQLTELYIGRMGLTDISPLSGLSQLTKLSLSNNEIIDIIPLSGLSQLKVLWLSVNKIIAVSYTHLTLPTTSRV